MTSGRNLKESREGSKRRIYGTQQTWRYTTYDLYATNKLHVYEGASAWLVTSMVSEFRKSVRLLHGFQKLKPSPSVACPRMAYLSER